MEIEEDEDLIEQQRLLAEIRDLKALTQAQTWQTAQTQGDNDDHAEARYEDEISLSESYESEEEEPAQDQDQEYDEGGDVDPLVGYAGVDSLLGMDLNSLLGNYATEETLASGGREVGGNGAPSDAGPEAAARPTGSDAPPPDDDDVNIDLLPGEDIVPGTRLAALYDALEKNRALILMLKGVMVKVEDLIHRNWKDNTAIKQTGSRRHDRGHGSSTDPQSSQLQDESGRFSAPSSSLWRINGLTPAPNADSANLSEVLHQLPVSYERSRWSKAQVMQLVRGVVSEVHHVMTDRALAAGYKTREDLDKEFERIKTVELNSDEAQEVVGRLSPDHWERISLSFVKNRSASDCRSFYRHALAPQPPWSLEESTKLRALATTHNGRNWEQVAAALGPRRTPAQCLQRYLKFNRPDHVRTRTNWAPEDDALLRSLVERWGTRWVKISAEMGGRFDRHQLRDRWHGQTKRLNSRNVGRWYQDEDERLRKAVADVGKAWPEVERLVGTRTAQQCRERYANVVNPDLAQKAYTPAEYESIISVCEDHMKAHGRIVWKEVSELFPGRTDEMIRRVWRHKTGGHSESAKRKSGEAKPRSKSSDRLVSVSPDGAECPEVFPPLGQRHDHQPGHGPLETPSSRQDRGAKESPHAEASRGYRRPPPVDSSASVASGSMGIAGGPPPAEASDQTTARRKRRPPGWLSEFE